MSNLADMVIELLCVLTFQPEGRLDPEDLADVERSCWQSLIHDLSAAEQEEVRKAVESQVEHLRLLPAESMPEHLQTKLAMLEAFLNGDLR